MPRNIRNRLQVLKPTRFDIYRFIPLVLFSFLVIFTITIGIADPLPPPPDGGPGSGT